MKRRTLLGAAAIAPFAAAAPRRARAQAFPDKPIRFVVPYAPGGSTDTCSRIIAEKLTQLFGQQVVVENKPGGATIIGTEIVAKAKPDGFTILLTPGAISVNDAFGVTLPYNSTKDLAPVARFVDLPMLLAANNDAPFKTVAELITWSKAVPGRLVPYASAGVGSLPHLWGEYIKARTGIPMDHVGYKGSAEALRDVMAGHVPLFSDVLMPTASPIRAGKLRGLAVAMSKRSSLLPDVPTVGEVGLTGMEAAVPFGISTTGGTPAPIVARLNAAVNEALADATVKKRLEDLGFIAVGGTSEGYAKDLVAETEKWRKVIKDSKIPPPA
ncbi:MAG: tripartite tricarboxylate transporter substrate binding protein [Proteobacteria bacterium]|nr:tripartite tricarboxylate transporter substrate binding protein [Pseudomonadota bacterium]